MRASKFPARIETMIRTANLRGLNSSEIADHVNKSMTAKQLKVRYSVRTIAAKIANYNR